MPEEQTDMDPETRDLNGFERNRFFHGKLMTARDMHAEQDYHTERLETLTRLVSGAGVVTGLDVSVTAGSDDGIEIAVDPGVAVDEAGRPIVVSERTTSPLSAPSDNTINVYLDYDEATTDAVPVPGSEGVYRDDSTYNRIVETFEITYTEGTDPRPVKDVPNIEFPSKADVGEGQLEVDDPSLVDVAASYLDEAAPDVDATGQSRVFLGAYEQGSDDQWRPLEGDDAPRRSQVYTNDMLYAALARHVTDFDNPHDVSAEQATSETFDELRQEIDDLREQVESIDDGAGEPTRSGLSLERYILVKTSNSFGLVVDRFRSDVAAKVAANVVREARRALEGEEPPSTERFVEAITTIAEREHELANLLENRPVRGSWGESFSAFDRAVRDLMEIVKQYDAEREREGSNRFPEFRQDPHRIAVAQDRVCETARRLTDVVEM